MGFGDLHITNGNNLTDYLNRLKIKGDFLTWQEMLCEGPTTELVGSDDFLNLRKKFLLDFYDVEFNDNEFIRELDILNHTDAFERIILWFEYDLFCHINLIALISTLRQKKVKIPLFLVCSGRIKGEDALKALNELTAEQLQKHFDNKIRLKTEDIDLMSNLWRIYCGKDHNLFKPFIVQNSSFPYLSNCLKAHLQRFPDSITGLSTLEMHTLQMIAAHKINSRRHLLGYILNFQGYYGFGDLQLSRMIDALEVFYLDNNDQLILNEKGIQMIGKKPYYCTEIRRKMIFGGVQKKNFSFSKSLNKLIPNL